MQTEFLVMFAWMMILFNVWYSHGEGIEKAIIEENDLRAGYIGKEVTPYDKASYGTSKMGSRCCMMWCRYAQECVRKGKV